MKTPRSRAHGLDDNIIRGEVTRTLQAAGLAAFPAITIRNWPKTSTCARGLLCPAGASGGRRAATCRRAVELLDTPCQVRRPAPCLGQDTEDVLQRVLGYSADEVATLKDNEA